MYLYTRQWEREQRAERIEMQAALIQSMALIGGAKAGAAKQFVSGMVTDARLLRQPEIQPEWDLAPEIQRFLNPELFPQPRAEATSDAAAEPELVDDDAEGGVHAVH